MIEFLTLTFRNFISYGNTTTKIDLSTPGSTLVVGRNLDGTTDGAASNGVGKSTIVNAITYALYDRPLSDINKDNLVNTINGKHMEVTVTFRIKDKYYKVVRARKMKAGPYGNWVKLYERAGDANFTDEDEVSLDSSKNSTEYIAKVVGVPYELFVRIIVFSGSHIPFLSLPSKHPSAPSQQSFIEELFDLKVLTAKAEVLKSMIKANESEFALINAKAEMAERQRATHATQLAETEKKLREWEEQRSADIADIQASLKRVEGIDLDAQQALYDELVTAQTESKAITLQISGLRRDLSDIDKHITSMSGELAHLHDAKCPYCKQEYVAEDKIVELSGHLSELEDAKRQLEQELAMLVQKQESVAARVDTLNSELAVGDIKELLTIKLKKTELEEGLKKLEVAENPYTSMVALIRSQHLEEVDTTALNSLAEEIEHQKFLLKLLTKNDSLIRKAMLNKNLPFLNSRLNYYLRRMELPHIVEFTHELTPSISRFGSSMEFNNLSTGQKARVNLALSLAFRDVLQNLHRRINLFCVDEVLDVGLDSTGVMMAAKLLKEEARKSGTCMFVISHREEISASFDKKMYVLFENSFSRAYQTPEDVRIAEQKMSQAA